MYRIFIIIFISFLSFMSVFAQTNKNNTVLDTLQITKALYSIPNGIEYDFKVDTSRIALHPNGDVYRWSKNVISGMNNDVTFTLPQEFFIKAVCWTNSGNLVVFSKDTLYMIDSTLQVLPIAGIYTPKVKLRAVGDNDVAFCVMGGLKIFRININEQKIEEVVALKSAVRDFFVYDGIYFIAVERGLVAYKKLSAKDLKKGKKELLPIFSNSGPIYKIAMCSNVGMFMVDDSGLWFINKKLQKRIVTNQYVSDIQSGYYDHGYFLLPNNIWMYLNRISLFDVKKKK